MTPLERVLKNNGIRLVVTEGSKPFYRYGHLTSAMKNLRGAANDWHDGMTVGDGKAAMIYFRQQLDGADYHIYMYGQDEAGSGWLNIKLILAISGMVIAATILISVFLTNRYLSRHVWQHIKTPLQVLDSGVQEVIGGNLDHRLNYDGEDEFAPIVAAFNEMTARLQASAQQIQKNEESRRLLIAGISHDLRSPLTSIKAYVEGLQDGIAATPEARQRYLNIIAKKTEDIDRLVSQLFAYVKLDMSGAVPQLKTLRLDTFVADLAAEVAPDYARQGLVLATADLEAVTAQADAGELRRVLTNIMDNAVKYKTAAIGHMMITLQKENDNAVLRLADDGPGVPASALKKIFDVLYRVDVSRKNPRGGSGLGLALAERSICRMGGHIHAENVATGGLEIVIALRGISE